MCRWGRLKAIQWRLEECCRGSYELRHSAKQLCSKAKGLFNSSSYARRTRRNTWRGRSAKWCKRYWILLFCTWCLEITFLAFTKRKVRGQVGPLALHNDRVVGWFIQGPRVDFFCFVHCAARWRYGIFLFLVKTMKVALGVSGFSVSHDVLALDKCLDALAKIRRAKWFQVCYLYRSRHITWRLLFQARCFDLTNCIMMVRLMRDIRNRLQWPICTWVSKYSFRLTWILYIFYTGVGASYWEGTYYRWCRSLAVWSTSTYFWSGCIRTVSSR